MSLLMEKLNLELNCLLVEELGLPFWSLGQDYKTNSWPACGEIDFMEHVGNSQNVIHGSLHYPGNSGGNANTASTTIANASTEFHVYKTI